MEKDLGVDFMRSLIWQPHGSRISVRSFCRRASRPRKQRCIPTGSFSSPLYRARFSERFIYWLDSGLLLEWLGQLSGGFDVAFVGFAALFGI